MHNIIGLLSALIIVLVSCRINVHIFPHSHLDPLWLFNPMEYSIQTNMILEGVMKSLLEDRQRTFIWESPFFLDMFLNSHGNQTVCFTKTTLENSTCIQYSDAMQFLINRGQIELVGGGWTSHDEALCNFYGSVDDIATGREWINSMFGSNFLPRTGWYIDSFGHSATTSGVLQDMNYSFQLLNRVPYSVKRSIRDYGPHTFFLRRSAGEAQPFRLEAIGGAGGISASDAYSADGLLTAILPDHYSLSIRASLDDRHMSASRLTEIADHLYRYILKQLQESRGSLRKSHIEGQNSPEMNFILLAGDDFSFRNSVNAFRNMERLAETININDNGRGWLGQLHWRGEELKVRAFLSTPSQYLQSLVSHRESGSGSASPPPLPAGVGHFLPYSDNFFNDWTGFYSSRPQLKQMISDFETRIRIVDNIVCGLIIMCATTGGGCKWNDQDQDKLLSSTKSLHKVLALAHHHDSITGTSKRRAIRYLVSQLKDGLQSINSLLASALLIVETRNSNPATTTEFRSMLEGININLVPTNSFATEAVNVQSRDLIFLFDLSSHAPRSTAYHESALHYHYLPVLFVDLDPDLRCLAHVGGFSSIHHILRAVDATNSPFHTDQADDSRSPTASVARIMVPLAAGATISDEEYGYTVLTPTACEDTIDRSAKPENSSTSILIDLEDKLRDVISSLSVREVVSGVGWHSSGAYLLRTPLNALISGCIDVIVGYVGSFLLLNAFLTRILRCFHNALLRLRSGIFFSILLHYLSVLHLTSESLFCIVYWTIFLVAVSIVLYSMSTGFVLWYVLSPHLWSEPLLPYRGVKEILSNCVGKSSAFGAGVILQLVVLLVLCVHFSAFDVIFRWINKNKTAHDGYSLNLNVVHRSRRSVHLFVAVFVAILTFAISASYFLTHPEHSSRHYSSFLFESSSGCFNRENSVCEIVSSLNRDTRVHVRHIKPQNMRPQSAEVDIKHVFDIDVSCRVSDPGRDLLLRIELSSFASHTERILGYNEASRKSSRQRPLPPPRSSAEQTFSLRVSDGVQCMSHPYDWKSPLSANFMPCSHAFEVFDANNVDSPLFTFVPSRPVGIVVYKSYLEIMVHRSLLFDDEKGLKEPLLDNSWNRLGLLVFLSSQHEHEYERSLEARPSVQNFLDSGKRGALVVSNKEGKSYSASRRLVESHISERLSTAAKGTQAIKTAMQYAIVRSNLMSQSVTSVELISAKVVSVGGPNVRQLAICAVAYVRVRSHVQGPERERRTGVAEAADMWERCSLDCLLCSDLKTWNTGATGGQYPTGTGPLAMRLRL